jgi:DNA-binding response OmpR family regulator
MRILLVEDHPPLQALLTAHLRDRGFAVDAVHEGAAALACATATEYDAVILDLGLPDMDGLDVLRHLRAGAHAGLPTLILTARDSVAERVAGLDAGADDYILKPFETAELDARLRAVLRRPGARLHPVHRFADLAFDSASRAASREGAAIDLTPREAALFEVLIRAGAAVVVRDALVESLYRLDEDVSGNALEATVSRLRRKLAAAGSRVRVEALRGIGYRLAE